MRDHEPAAYEAAALRWLARLCSERDVSLDHALEAALALRRLEETPWAADALEELGAAASPACGVEDRGRNRAPYWSGHVARARGVVRRTVAVMGDSRRRVEERLALRFPRVMARGSRYLFRQHPHSRLRRTIVPRVVRSGVQAASRGDFEAAFALLALLERRIALREVLVGLVRRF